MTKLLNDVKRSELANALALHDFAINNYDLKGWVAYVVELFRKYGLEPTRMGISAPSLKSGKMKTYVREVKKLDIIDNLTITGIEIQATMHASDDSCWDDIFSVVLSVRDCVATCIIVLDNALVPFNSHIWNNIIESMANFFKPRYGYGFQRSFRKGPEWYPLGIIGRSGNVIISDQEREAINCWGNTYHKGKYSTGDLRDIYPLNVLSAAHNQRMVDGVALFDWINADSNRGTLTNLSENLWSWWVDEEQIDLVRYALKPTRILLCAS
jgi:hypothetical protein